MEKNKHAHKNDMGTLAGDARALMVATADVAGEKIGRVRERLAVALENASEVAGNLRDKAIDGAKVTDRAVRKHPYKALAMGIGAGLLFGFLAGRRTSR
jgi:ElaB/YqjD/DUF883 family membrane-anchored ribosome-binding protein